MLPVIALIGRPNVGKSTLFNRITRSRDALVADFPGLTRDRQYGDADFNGSQFIVIDTGGIAEAEQEIEHLMSQQTSQAIEEADVILFLVDAKQGITPADYTIANHLRTLTKRIHLVVNKVDGIDMDVATAEFYEMGFTSIYPIAASQGRGVMQLLQEVCDQFPEQPEREEVDVDAGIRLAIIGRPNVGKSTLVNRILGEERVVVFDMPGTTRDTIKIPMTRGDQAYTLIDTAGVRRRARINEAIEKFSVVKTLQAVEDADVVLLMLDARDGVTEQDLHLLGFIIDSGRSLVIGVNKWDGLSIDARDRIRADLARRLDFVTFAKIQMISALHGTGVGELFPLIEEAYRSAVRTITTAEINKVLGDIVIKHPPPMVRGRRAKLRYGHMGGRMPPLIVLHGNMLDELPDSYKRYLMNTLRKAFNLVGTPIRLEFVSGTNPFEGKKNVLTAHQAAKKRRAMEHYKKK